MSRYGIEHPGIGKLEKWTVQAVKPLGLDRWVEFRLEELLIALQESDAHVKRIEKQVGGFVHPTADYQRIHTIVGIGPVLGMHILLESGDFGRFPSAGDYASYCRTVKSERTSNEKSKGSNNRKNGNPYLAWALIEVATFAMRYEPRIHAWYERKSARCGKIKARKALAGKMAKAIWHVMHGKEFDLDLLFN